MYRLWRGEKLSENGRRNAILKFCERGGQKRLLGEIRLSSNAAISIGGSEFILFRVRGSTNYCLPRIRLWAHYLLHSYSQWRRNDPADMRMTLLEQRAASVTFIRPHPLCLVSIGDKTSGNIFPMNLMGDLGNGYFGFALREYRLAAHLVERAGRMALSGVPLLRCSVAVQLAGNHKKESIDWKQLPFETKLSMTFGIPVPILLQESGKCRSKGSIKSAATGFLSRERFLMKRMLRFCKRAPSMGSINSGDSEGTEEC